MIPPWLQELRDLLALTSYDERQSALSVWEQRWILELHWRRIIPNTTLLVPQLRAEATHEMGKALAEAMGTVTVQHHAHHVWSHVPAIDVRGDAVALRREPKTDD